MPVYRIVTTVEFGIYVRASSPEEADEKAKDIPLDNWETLDQWDELPEEVNELELDNLDEIFS